LVFNLNIERSVLVHCVPSKKEVAFGDTLCYVFTLMTQIMEPKIISPVNIEKRKELDIRAGDTVRVMSRVEEKGKTRLQAFEGIVIAVKHGKEAGGTFTVRRVASGVGVERTFTLYSPLLDSIEIVKRSKVRRAKLYHLKKKATREIKRQMRRIRGIPDFAMADSIDETENLAESDEAQVSEDMTPETISEVSAEATIDTETNEIPTSEGEKKAE